MQRPVKVMLTIQNALMTAKHTDKEHAGLHNMHQIGFRESNKFSEMEIKSMVLSQNHIKASSPVVAAEFSVGKGARRADIAMLDEHDLIGFEIKSDFDSLVRLRQQSNEYIKYFDKVILATTGKHLKKALNICPKQLGIWVVCSNGTVEAIRDAKRTSFLNVQDLISMLTKAEKYRLLRSMGQEDIGALAADVLRDAVKDVFRSRYSEASSKFWTEVFKNSRVLPENLSILSRFAENREVCAQRKLESVRYWEEWNSRAETFFRSQHNANG